MAFFNAYLDLRKPKQGRKYLKIGHSQKILSFKGSLAPVIKRK